jgi:hypothetical protein
MIGPFNIRFSAIRVAQSLFFYVVFCRPLSCPISSSCSIICRGRRDRMLVGFTTIYAISAYHH